ncbi:MAG: glycosyltransferase [Pseudomonadota bacterium]
MADPDISVVICTQNRGMALADVLDSLIAMDVPSDVTWELVVVDNASTDDTPQVIQSYADKLPLNALREAQPGLSFARNCAVRAARGAYLVWTDDDVRVHTNWLASYARAFRDHPEAGYFGGPITPIFEGTSPDWLVENIDRLGSQFARRDLGDEERPFEAVNGDNPFGANYAIRADIQRRYEYPTYLGVSPKFRRSGEEVAVLRSVREEGFGGYWVPDAAVDHMIPEKRQTFAYIANYHRAIGETWAVLSVRDTPYKDLMGEPISFEGRIFRGVPLWIWRRMATLAMKLRLAKTFGGSAQWLGPFMDFNRLKGAVDYLQRHAKGVDA